MKATIQQNNTTGDQMTDENPTEQLKINFTTTLRGNGNTDHPTPYEDERNHVWDLSEQLDLPTFLRETTLEFEEGGHIEVRDDEEDKPLEKRIGYKIVQTTTKTNIVYLLAAKMNGKEKILKGGKCKGELFRRSYTAGTQHNWTITGQASPTNYIYSQVFRSCVENNIEIKFYIHSAPTTRAPYPKSGGGEGYIEISPYEEIEKELNAHLVTSLGRKPIGEGDLENLYKQ
jgi:hypothetical protein